jgi:hypothetical protein
LGRGWPASVLDKFGSETVEEEGPAPPPNAGVELGYGDSGASVLPVGEKALVIPKPPDTEGKDEGKPLVNVIPFLMAFLLWILFLLLVIKLFVNRYFSFSFSLFLSLS